MDLFKSQLSTRMTTTNTTTTDSTSTTHFHRSTSSIQIVVDSFLKQVQQYSGIAFSFFLSLHLMNTMTAILSQQTYDSMQQLLRRFYRPQWLLGDYAEYYVVLGPLALHMLSGVSRRLFTRRRIFISRKKIHQTNSDEEEWIQTKSLTSSNEEERIHSKSLSLSTETVITKMSHFFNSFISSKISTFLKRIFNEPLQLHRIAGYILIILMPIHVTTTRWTYPINSEFSQVTFSMERKPGMAIMLPYYTIMLVSGVYHLCYGLNAALFSYQCSKKRLFTIFGMVLILAFIGLLGAGGVLYPDRIDRTNYVMWEQL
nr:unnamed protein product [Naegleria fowleri]